MSTPSDYAVVVAMHTFGGSFVQALALAYDRADPENFAKLKAAFPDEWAVYAAIATRTAASVTR
jgi:hypothetical protein